MKNDLGNPFADYGTIVYGDRFIGRKKDCEILENRIIRPREAGNLAIIGEPHIGKSSLIYQTIITRKNELISQNVVPIWMNLGIYKENRTFFFDMVSKCVKEMRESNLLDERIQQSAYCIFSSNQSWNEEYIQIQQFFEEVRQAGYRVVVILDEFDHARHMFKGDTSNFQKLRELSYRPEWRVAFVTASRRSIREIEQQTKAISTFDGIFQKHYLGMFVEEDMQEYFEKLSSVGLSISMQDEEKINYYCGGHPYLLEMIGNEIVEIFRREGEVDVDRAACGIEQSLLDYYDCIMDLLKEDGTLSKLLQVLFGPVVDVKRKDIERLLKYGLLRPDSQGVYVSFSEHVHSYFNMIQREVDLWPIFSQTERALRSIITEKMHDFYGEHWIEKLEKKHPELKTTFEKCLEKKSKEENSFGDRASRNLIDFTYPDDLFTIIFKEWGFFQPIFGKNKSYWSQCAQMLSKTRNPLAHNRPDSLNDYQRQIAEGFCREILTLVTKQSR
jgi:hypothetical protein